MVIFMTEYMMTIKSEQGSALVSVLTIVVILTIMVGTILSVETIQQRFIHRDVERLQLLYEAEAGVYRAMQLLRENPFLEVSDTLLILTENLASIVSIESVGGYYHIRSTTGPPNDIRQRQMVVLATVAERVPSEFRRAVYLWDKTSRLNVAGRTVINGDIEVGQRGVSQNTIAGIRYTGESNGVSRFNPEITPPFFDDRLLQRSLSDFDRAISDSLQRINAYAKNAEVTSSVLLPGELPIYFVEGDLLLTPADSALLIHPLMVIASENLEIEGPLRYAAGSHFLAGNRVRLQGQIQGENGVFYGRQSLSTSDNTAISGQLLSRREIVIRDGSYVFYPSLLFLGGSVDDYTGTIDIQGKSIVEGSLIHGHLLEEPKEARGHIIIGKDALVIGGIYNPYGTELHGTVHGSVLTHHFFFYRSPTRYVNWLLDVSIDTALRPENFHVPLLFNANPDLIVIDWEVSHPTSVFAPEQTGLVL